MFGAQNVSFPSSVSALIKQNEISKKNKLERLKGAVAEIKISNTVAGNTLGY